MTETPLSFRIVNWIGIIDQLASTEASRVLRPLDVPLPQFILLNHFSHRPDEARTVTTIARALQQPQPGVTKTVQKMVSRGWLTEQASGGDARSKELRLTGAGQAKHRAALAALTPGLAAAFVDWPEADMVRLLKLLDRLKVWFDASRDSPLR